MTEFYDPTHSGPSSLRSRLAAIYGSVTRALRRIPLHSWFRAARDTLKTLFRRLWTLVKRALSRATRLIVKVWRRAILASVQIWQWMKTLWGAVRLSPAMQGVFLAGFAMAAANFQASKARNEFIQMKRKQEEWEIDNLEDQEKEELITLSKLDDRHKWDVCFTDGIRRTYEQTKDFIASKTKRNL